ncbi:MAG TPA: ABC transporter ATP-binding protein [Paracoccaceae bacterium]
MTRVNLSGLTKHYPGAQRPAVDGLTLEVPSGALVALLGPSGCGKTTVLKMIAGLIPATSGQIAFDGQSVQEQRAEDRGAVMVFQNHLLFPYMSVAENIGFGLKMRHVPRAEIAARVAEMLDLVRLPGLGDRRPQQLSGGQQQRVALARALIVRPKVLLLDEPLSNLDAHLRLEMRDLIRGLQRDLAITTIFVTHDQEEAVVLADCIALILDGRMAQYARPEVFYHRPADLAVARFFGGQNFVPGVVSGGMFHSALGPLLLPLGLADGPGTLTFRPENARLSGGGAGFGTGGGTGRNRISLRVRAKTYLGTQTRLHASAGDQPIDLLVNPADAAGIAEGSTISATLPPDALWVLRG